MTVERTLNRFIDISAIIAGTLLAAQFVSISIDVLLRYFFEHPLEWVIYSNEWSLFFIAFLGAAWLQRERGHVRMDLLLTHMGKHLQDFVEVLSSVFAIVISVVLMWFGIIRAHELFELGAYDFFKVDYVPLYLIYLVVPIGSFLLCLQSILDLIRITGLGSKKSQPS